MYYFKNDKGRDPFTTGKEAMKDVGQIVDDMMKFEKEFASVLYFEKDKFKNEFDRRKKKVKPT